MSTQDPLEALKKEIDSIQSSINALHSKVRLSDVRDSVEDLQTRSAVDDGPGASTHGNRPAGPGP
jgi:predicted  nucleic acid-binding Zn-ribbon protein